MKTLSVKQPWASIIMSGRKEVEIRTWKTDYRGPLVIHAGKKIDREAMDFFMGRNPNWAKCKIIRDLEFPTGCILGKVKIETIALVGQSEWGAWRELHCVPGQWPGGELYAWWLSNPGKLKHPIPHKGQLGLFNIDEAAFQW